MKTKQQWDSAQRIARIEEIEKELAALKKEIKEEETPAEFVLVYDHFRFARPLQGIVQKRSAFTDTVYVILRESNNYKYPKGAIVRVHEKQIERIGEVK